MIDCFPLLLVRYKQPKFAPSLLMVMYPKNLHASSRFVGPPLKPKLRCKVAHLCRMKEIGQLSKTIIGPGGVSKNVRVPRRQRNFACAWGMDLFDLNRIGISAYSRGPQKPMVKKRGSPLHRIQYLTGFQDTHHKP